ncbi:MAG TPA: PfkB family carbohydrate kinase [Lacipirellulaceae bacterium]|nr:PfkB family carbohydrate kinase [Lacipirellulaceae bacterium]
MSVVGEDFPQEHIEYLEQRGVDLAGLQVVPGGKTMFWEGRYHPNMNDRDSLETQLNVFGQFDPKLPEEFRNAKFVFLANGMPSIQLSVLEQVPGRRLAVADTMDLWINHHRADLDRLLELTDGLVINDIEARLLTGTENLVAAGRAVQRMGPKFVVIKKGEHGAMFFGEHETYVLPAYPTDQLIDPTGAGDSFAGGMMGYLAERDEFDAETLKTAMAYGIVAASFNVEGFGVERIAKICRDDVEKRMAKYRQMLTF